MGFEKIGKPRRQKIYCWRDGSVDLEASIGYQRELYALANPVEEGETPKTLSDDDAFDMFIQHWRRDPTDSTPLKCLPGKQLAAFHFREVEADDLAAARDRALCRVADGEHYSGRYEEAFGRALFELTLELATGVFPDHEVSDFSRQPAVGRGSVEELCKELPPSIQSTVGLSLKREIEKAAASRGK